MGYSSVSAYLKLTVALLFTLNSGAVLAALHWDFSVIFDDPNRGGYLSVSVFIHVNCRDGELVNSIPPFHENLSPVMFISGPQLNVDDVSQLITRQVAAIHADLNNPIITTSHRHIRDLRNRRPAWYVLTLFSNQHVILLMYPYHILMHRLNSIRSTYNHVFHILNGMPLLDITRADPLAERTRVRAMGFNNIFPNSMMQDFDRNALMHQYRLGRRYLGMVTSSDSAIHRFRELQVMAVSQEPNQITRLTTDWFTALRRFQRYIHLCQITNQNPLLHSGWIDRSSNFQVNSMALLRRNPISFYILDRLVEDNRPLMLYNGPSNDGFDYLNHQWVQFNPAIFPAPPTPPSVQEILPATAPPHQPLACEINQPAPVVYNLAFMVHLVAGYIDWANHAIRAIQFFNCQRRHRG